MFHRLDLSIDRQLHQLVSVVVGIFRVLIILLRVDHANCESRVRPVRPTGVTLAIWSYIVCTMNGVWDGVGRCGA